jgi:hypothetical protein
MSNSSCNLFEPKENLQTEYIFSFLPMRFFSICNVGFFLSVRKCTSYSLFRYLFIEIRLPNGDYVILQIQTRLLKSQNAMSNGIEMASETFDWSVSFIDISWLDWA